MFRLQFERPQWLSGLVFLGIPAFIVLTFFILGPTGSIWYAIFLALIAAVLLGRITVPFKTELPAKAARVRDLVRLVSTLNNKIWSKEEVFAKIRTITVEQLGVKPEQVNLDTHWVRDLDIS